MGLMTDVVLLTRFALYSRCEVTINTDQQVDRWHIIMMTFICVRKIRKILLLFKIGLGNKPSICCSLNTPELFEMNCACFDLHCTPKIKR